MDMKPQTNRNSGCIKRGALVLGCALVVAAGYAAYRIHDGDTYAPHLVAPPTLPAQNGMDDLMSAYTLFTANGSDGEVNDIYKQPGHHQEQDPDVIAATQRLIDRNAKVFALIRQGIAKPCAVPITHGWSMSPYPHAMRELIRLTGYACSMRLHQGQYAAAMDDSLDGMQLGVCSERNGNIIAYLSGANGVLYSQRLFPEMADHFTAPECERMASRLQHIITLLPSKTDILQTERYTTISGLVYELDNNPIGLAALTSLGDTPPKPRKIDRLYWRYMRKQTIQEMDAYFAEVIAQQGKPADQRHTVALPKGRIARLATPDEAWLCATYDRYLTSMRVMLGMLKIRSYQLTRHALPTSLSQLDLPREMMQDPYSGAPLTYRANGADYLLYSVGENLKDDGGKPRQAFSHKSDVDGGLRDSILVGSRWSAVAHMLPPDQTEKRIEQ